MLILFFLHVLHESSLFFKKILELNSTQEVKWSDILGVTSGLLNHTYPIVKILGSISQVHGQV